MTTAAMPAEYERFLFELIRACARQQPTLGLLDGTVPVQWLGTDGDRPVVSLGGEHGTLDPGAVRFVPTDPESIRQRLAERLHREHGDAELPIGHGSTGVDWGSIEILAENDGRLHGVVHRTVAGPAISVTVEADWRVHLEPLVPAPDPGQELPGELTLAALAVTQAEPEARDALTDYVGAHPEGDPVRSRMVADAVRLAVTEHVGGAR